MPYNIPKTTATCCRKRLCRTSNAMKKKNKKTKSRLRCADFTCFASQQKIISQPAIIKQLNCYLNQTHFGESSATSQLSRCYSTSIWRWCFFFFFFFWSLNTVFQQRFAVWICLSRHPHTSPQTILNVWLPSASRRVQSIKASPWPTYL